MKVAIVHIGNSRGIRLPKAVLEQCNLTDEADLDVRDGQVILRAARRTRSGWEAAFAAMRKASDDRLLDADAAAVSAWDLDEWRW